MDPNRHTTHDGPTVWLLGEADHPDFAEAIALVRATADVVAAADARPPELILLAQSRPGVIAARDVEALQRRAPLAAIVALLGSWCEGETRTGRPISGALRLYWYDFPAWWRRQLALRMAGRCPDWALPQTSEFPRGSTAAPRGDPLLRVPAASSGTRIVQGGVIALDTRCWDTANALADVLRAEGFDTIWLRPGRVDPKNVGVTGGIWEGAQLDDAEAERLTAFCRFLADDHAPVVALLDFPRRDHCERARLAGAAAVLSKPWLNADLIATLQHVVGLRDGSQLTTVPRAA